MPTRRAVLAAGLTLAGTVLLHPAQARAASIPALRIRDDLGGRAISRLIYGGNEIGVMDHGLPSAMLDRAAGVTARRLGGDLMSAYNWTNNATNAGKNYRQSNGAFLLEALEIPKEQWGRPGVIIEAMHEASLEMGAQSLVTLPIAPYAAADFGGMVSEAEAAPSARFVPVRWSGRTAASDPVDPSVVDMPQLLARLVERYGSASGPRGIHGYALDNEPALWFQNHPRVTPQQTTIAAFIARSIAAARAIKGIDPAAKIFGPASWGATEMVSFQDAPDWRSVRAYGNFLAMYLDAFRKASEEDGQRLLDVLDVHWYPFSAKGGLFRSEDPAMDQALLDAPRSLSEAGFVEDSWVPRAFRHRGAEGLGLPILPALRRVADRWFPGTDLSVTEFNYGGAGRLAAALALVDVLGRFGTSGVYFATHWGTLSGWLGEAYRLYRMPDLAGRMFGDMSLAVEGTDGAGVAAYAAMDAVGPGVVVVNTSMSPLVRDLTFATGTARRCVGSIGFDADHQQTINLVGPEMVDGVWRLALPARSARRYAFA